MFDKRKERKQARENIRWARDRDLSKMADALDKIAKELTRTRLELAAQRRERDVWQRRAAAVGEDVARRLCDPGTGDAA